jgi:nicotinamidase-related amidase
MSNSEETPLGNWRHICVDMQRMFAEDTPWHVPWMKEVSPQVIEVASTHTDRTIFTRFITPRSPAEAVGQWRPYCEKWSVMTREHLPKEMLDIVPTLARFCPPALMFDKTTYSPWIEGGLDSMLKRDGVETLVITGAETDVCVLAMALGGIDLGYRAVVLSDAVCSGADETHDASLTLLGDRFSVQLNLVTTHEFLSSV